MYVTSLFKVKCALLASFVLQCLALPRPQAQAPNANLPVYPAARRDDVTFTYNSTLHGSVTVPDYYNWLEKGAGDAEVKAFIDAQNVLTQQYVDSCKSYDDVRAAVTKADDVRSFRPPRIVGPADNPMYYYMSQTTSSSTWFWFVATREELLRAEATNYANLPGKKFFDGDLLSTNGSIYSDGLTFSPSGKIVAYSVRHEGSDNVSFYFRSTSKPFVDPVSDPAEAAKGGPDRLPDELHDTKLSDVYWTKDDVGVFYQKWTFAQDDSSKDAQVYYHVMGTKQEQDILVVAKDDVLASNICNAAVSDDGDWLVVTSYDANNSNVQRVYLASLTTQPISSSMAWISVAPRFDYYLGYRTNQGNDFYWITNNGAPNWKIVRTHIDPSTARGVDHITHLQDEATYEDVIKEQSDSVLFDIAVVDNDKVFAWYTKDVKHELYQYELTTGKQVERILPNFIGSVDYVERRVDANELFIPVESFTMPYRIYRLHWSDNGKEPRATPSICVHRDTDQGDIKPDDFVTKQIFVPSNDGVNVPAYIVYHKSLKPDGKNPGMVAFDGAFDDIYMPTYSAWRWLWAVRYGAVYVSVNARGGGELGEKWHDGGRLLNKKNTFYDILAVSQKVVDDGWIAPGILVSIADTAGGLAALAVSNMAPQGLFGAVLAYAPVPTDMLRYTQYPDTQGYVSEFGDPSDGTYFDYLYSYSPIHNVDASKTYPFTLVTTSDYASPAYGMHAYKMAATLQYAQPNNPLPQLLHYVKNSGQDAAGRHDVRIDNGVIAICLVEQFMGLTPK